MLCLLREMFRIMWKARDQLGIEEEDPTDLLPGYVAFLRTWKSWAAREKIRGRGDKSLDSPAA